MAKRIDIRREKINLYNCQQLTDPLVFFDIISKKEIKIPRYKTIPRLVMSILSLSRLYVSANKETLQIETTKGRNRSVIDIWRHAISQYPDVNIFSIMEAIYSLCADEKVFGQYCVVVRRSVFRNHYLLGTSNFTAREYKIKFHSWKKLH